MMENLDGTKKLIPDDLKLEPISKEAAICLAQSPNAIMDYYNHLVEAYNSRVDDVNEYHELYMKIDKRFEDYKIEHRVMARIITDNGLWETFLNDDEFLEHLRGDDDAINNEE